MVGLATLFRQGVQRAVRRGGTSFRLGHVFGNFRDMPWGMVMHAEESYYLALSMVGNMGQLSIIEMMGVDTFLDAAEEAYNEGDPEGLLVSECPHPEAVGEILLEVAQYLIDMAEDYRDENAGSTPESGDAAEG